MTPREIIAAATSGEWLQGMASGRCRKPSHGAGHPGLKGSDPCDYEYTIRANDEFERCFVSIAPNVTLIGSDDNGPILKEADARFIAAAREGWPSALDRIEELERERPLCAQCGKRPAACLGNYEEDGYSFACDECCGHGNEDGHCERIADITKITARLAAYASAQEDDAGRTIASAAALRAELAEATDNYNTALAEWHIAVERAIAAEAENATLRAEVERLRKSVCCAGESHTCDQEAIMAAENRTDLVIIERDAANAELARVDAALREIVSAHEQGESKSIGWRCGWCGVVVGTIVSPDLGVAEGKAHSLVCEKNPAVADRDRLKALLVEACTIGLEAYSLDGHSNERDVELRTRLHDIEKEGAS